MLYPINIQTTTFTQLKDDTHIISPIAICFGKKNNEHIMLYKTGKITYYRDYIAYDSEIISLGDTVNYLSIIYSIELDSLIIFFSVNNQLYLHILKTKYTAKLSLFNSSTELTPIETITDLSLPILYTKHNNTSELSLHTNYPIFISQSSTHLFIASCWNSPIVFTYIDNEERKYDKINRYYFNTFSIDITNLSNPVALTNTYTDRPIRNIRSDGKNLFIYQNELQGLVFPNKDTHTTTEYLALHNTAPFIPFSSSLVSEYLSPSYSVNRRQCFPESTLTVISSDYCFWHQQPMYVWLLDNGTILTAEEPIIDIEYTTSQGIVQRSHTLSIHYGPIAMGTSFSIPVTLTPLTGTNVPYHIEQGELTLISPSHVRLLYGGMLVTSIPNVNITASSPLSFSIVGTAPINDFSLDIVFNLTGHIVRQY